MTHAGKGILFLSKNPLHDEARAPHSIVHKTKKDHKLYSTAQFEGVLTDRTVPA